MQSSQAGVVLLSSPEACSEEVMQVYRAKDSMTVHSARVPGRVAKRFEFALRDLRTCA